MGLRFGYIGNSKLLENCATDKTVSILTLNKINDNGKKIAKLRKVAKSNILNTIKVLENNKSLGINVYGITPRLFPLANYPNVEYFRYINALSNELDILGKFIIKNGVRVNIHVDASSIITAMSEKLYFDSLRNIEYQHALLNSLGLDDKYKIIINFSGAHTSSEELIERFKVTYEALEDNIKKRLVLSNIDNLIDIETTIAVSKKFSIPYYLNDYISAINSNIIDEWMETWNNTGVRPLLGVKDKSVLDSMVEMERNIDVIVNTHGKDMDILSLN